MNSMMLSVAAAMMGAEFFGRETALKNVCIDSRQCKKGDLFFALPGAQVDGHDYIQDVEAKGAIGVVVNRKVKTQLPQLLVQDVLKSLGLLAKAYRHRFAIPIVAITGSCGKTTVKEMLAGILSQQGCVLATQGNLNTEIGVPLTLLRMMQEHSVAVVEMGARQTGDIAYLMGITNPTVSLITNAGVAHLGVFGNEKNIAQTKGEIFSCLMSSGTAIINQDDKNALYWQDLIKDHQYTVTFGLKNAADIMAADIQLNSNYSRFELKTHLGAAEVLLTAPGMHNIENALAAAATACALGVSLCDIIAGLNQFQAVAGRLQFKSGYANAQIIDDTYNANPISTKAALSVLAQSAGKKILVLGDMFELGDDESLLHREIGEAANKQGIDMLMGVGELSRFAVEGFGAKGKHYISKWQLIDDLRQQMDANTTVLVKGSRGMKMEEIVLSLMEDQKEPTC